MKKLLAVVPLLAFALPLFAQQKYNSDVENIGADCTVTLPASFNTANSKLPDPFKKIDGTRISTKEEWTCRRQEILKLAERTVYGTKPPKPASVTGTVSNNSISVKVGNASFSATVSLPTTGTAPYPAVIRYDNSGADATVLRSNGVAVINYTTSTVGTGTRNAKSGAFYTANPSYSKTGHLAAWAWGVSRIIDVIEQSDGKIFKADAIGVTGCSRDGKGAFVAGVLDQRVALTMPMESGTGGTNIMRGAYADRAQGGGTDGAQSPQSAYGEQPWLGDDFNAFTDNPNNLPIDMHEAIALVAPRGFLVLEKTAASAGKWLNIPSSHASALAAAEVYKALGIGGNMHYINTPTSSHCQWTANIYDTRVKDFIDIFLHRTKTPGTEPLFTATAAPDMTKWIDWTTPALSGKLVIGDNGPAPSGFILTTTASPSMGGDVTLTPPPANGRYEEGQKVTATAVPKDGWKFDSWDGDVSGTGASIEITMAKNKSVTAKFTPTADGTDNLIRNGNFTNTQNWTLNKNNSSNAAFAVSGGAANITGITRPSGTGAADHSLQLVQNGIPLTQGMKYRLTFDASSSSARDISVYIQMDTSPYTQYTPDTAGFIAELTAEKESFSYEFEMTKPTDDNGRIAFNFGSAASDVSISDVKLVYIAGTTAIGYKFFVSATAQRPSNLRAAALPNKAINVTFSARENGAAVIKLYNLKGNLLSTAKLQTSAGRNYSHTFNTGKIPNGFYLIDLRGNGKIEQARIVVSQ